MLQTSSGKAQIYVIEERLIVHYGSGAGELFGIGGEADRCGRIGPSRTAKKDRPSLPTDWPAKCGDGPVTVTQGISSIGTRVQVHEDPPSLVFHFG